MLSHGTSHSLYLAYKPGCNEEMRPYAWSGVETILCVMTLAHSFIDTVVLPSEVESHA